MYFYYEIRYHQERVEFSHLRITYFTQSEFKDLLSRNMSVQDKIFTIFQTGNYGAQRSDIQMGDKAKVFISSTRTIKLNGDTVKDVAMTTFVNSRLYVPWYANLQIGYESKDIEIIEEFLE